MVKLLVNSAGQLNREALGKGIAYAACHLTTILTTCIRRVKIRLVSELKAQVWPLC